MNKLTLNDYQFQNTHVLVRVDYNVPLDESGHVTDDTRITASLPTIKFLLDKDASVILMSHLGRPKGKPNPKYSLKPAAERLSQLLGTPVQLANDCIGTDVETQAKNLKAGEALVLENLRFHEEEEKNDPGFAKQLAALGDVYVNDAFGSAHRAHASTEGVTQFLKPAIAGFLLEKEIDYLGRAVGNPERPYTAILGGAKISGKIDVIQNLMNKVDTLIIGGGMMFTFLKAQGLEIGTSLLEEDKLDLAKQILADVAAKKMKLLLPVDAVVADAFHNDANAQVVPANCIPVDMIGVDIGPETIKHFTDAINFSKTIVWNGPMGVFEMPNFAKGTNAIAYALVDATKKGAVTIVGGGDTAAAITQAGLAREVSHVSTGGGASLEFLEGKTLPGVTALTDKVENR